MTVATMDVPCSALPRCATAVGWQAFRAEMEQLFDRFAQASTASPLPRPAPDERGTNGSPIHAASR